MLFRQCRLGIVNKDDAHVEEILKGHTCEVETFGFSKDADIHAVNTKLVKRPGYLGVAYTVEGLLNFDVEIDVPGKFSVYNSLTAIGDLPSLQCFRGGYEKSTQRGKDAWQDRNGKSFR